MYIIVSPGVSTSSANFSVEMSPSVNQWISSASPATKDDRSQLIQAKRCLFNSPKTNKMVRKLKLTTQKLAINRTTISRLKREILKSKDITNSSTTKFKSKDSAVLCRMQLRKKGPWKRDEKQFSTALCT